MIITPTPFSQQLLNRPLALNPMSIAAVMSIELSEIPADPPGAMGYEIIEGVAVITVSGALFQSIGSVYSYGFATGYDGIRANFLHALNNEKVRAIALQVSSPGGIVSGCFDLADLIYESRSIKPTLAILVEDAYSAAYALASACQYVVVPRTGGTGSVGVICMAVEFSKALTTAGITVTIFQYGDRKADGNEYTPLEKAARERFQGDIDTMGDLFVTTVARNRKLSKATVRGTQATTFLGASGVEIGFADAVMAPDEAFRSLLDELGD
jgi:ClpP class serine protease